MPVVKEGRNKQLLFLGLSSPDDLKKYMLSGVEAHTCSICQNFSHKSKYTLQNHIESKHFPNTFVYTCTKCDKNVFTREALICHKKRCYNFWSWDFLFWRTCSRSPFGSFLRCYIWAFEHMENILSLMIYLWINVIRIPLFNFRSCAIPWRPEAVHSDGWKRSLLWRLPHVFPSFQD